MSDLIRENYQRFAEEGIRAEFRLVQTEGYGVRARSSYYDYEDRLIMVDYRVVAEDEVPEDERADRTEDDDRTGFDAYVVEEADYHRVEDELPPNHLLDADESPGWVVGDSSESVRTYMPVEDGEVVRQAGNMPVPTFLLWLHYNQKEGVLDDGGLWDEFMRDEDPEPVTDGGEDVREVQVGQVDVTLEPEDTIPTLFSRLSSEVVDDLLNPNPRTYALVRQENVEETEKGVEHPEEEDYVPADLSTVEDGDALHLFRVRKSARPAYPEEVEA